MKIFFYLVLSVVLLSVGCSSDNNSSKENPLFPPVDNATTVRLKHLLTTGDVVEALGGYTNGWDVKELNVTNYGAYPSFPYIYYYNLPMEIETSGETTQTRSVYVQAGGPVDTDVTLEQFLAENNDYVAVNDAQLATYPRTYVVKMNDNDNEEWIIDLYTPHIAKDGNHTMHSIHLSGYNTPPPSDSEAVKAMLRLLEKHD